MSNIESLPPEKATMMRSLGSSSFHAIEHWETARDNFFCKGMGSSAIMNLSKCAWKLRNFVADEGRIGEDNDLCGAVPNHAFWNPQWGFCVYRRNCGELGVKRQKLRFSKPKKRGPQASSLKNAIYADFFFSILGFKTTLPSETWTWNVTLSHLYVALILAALR